MARARGPRSRACAAVIARGVGDQEAGRLTEPRSRIDERADQIKQLPSKQQQLVLIMIDSFLAQARHAS